MPWWGRGRGWRWWYWLTGMPGWARAAYGLPAFGRGWFRGNPYPFCRWFPWLPRWWWTGMYGPVRWTPQGPVLVSQTQSSTPSTTQPLQPIQPIPQIPVELSKQEEINYLKEELRAMEEEKRILEQEIQSIKKRIKELESK